ncbi:hypothetical protein [Roseiflexus sp.]|uniref:hypothetical protein n=1 Tax=Roseiflexus sp. TaxID=2562120 RepID=UPI002583B385|nr:hypothetical protein [Roseiflexus sp.]
MLHQAARSRIVARAIDLADFDARLTGFFQDQRLSAEIPERSGIVLTRDGTTLRSLIPQP